MEFKEYAIWKIRKMSNLCNSKNLRFGKFEKSSIRKTPKICNLENSKKFQVGKF